MAKKILDEFIDEILVIDKNIRFAGIYHSDDNLTKMKNSVESYLDSKETEQSVHDAIYRWKQQEKLSKKIGSPDYSITKYGKVQLITISLPNGLILISCELHVDPISIVNKVSSVRDWYVF